VLAAAGRQAQRNCTTCWSKLTGTGLAPLRATMRARVTDDWYESEESTRAGMVVELQRMRRRFRARPLRVIALATALTTAITYKIATHSIVVEAEVVLALTEGTMSAEKRHGIPVDDLRQYVDGVLITDAKLADLIERRDLFPSRSRLGMEHAIEELRGQLDIQIWKNSFVYYDEDAARAEHSARIGIAVSDTDPDRAYAIAGDLAAIVIDTSQQHRLRMNAQLSSEVELRRAGLVRRLDEMTRTEAVKRSELVRAQARRADGPAHALQLELAELAYEQKEADKQLGEIAVSRDAIADRIAAAGLDTRIAIVEERRPDRPEHRELVIAMAAIVIAVGTLLGCALLLGAFDARVHDTDDLGRLGLPVLGNLPAFAGDHVGSLSSRGVPRALTSNRARWRSSR
jgi:capsular polysaccharide biosynthesis protein